MSIRVGNTIPTLKAEAFLPSGKFESLDLARYKGKWLVVFFYPLDFTFVCPTEIRSFSEHYDEFKRLGAEVVAVSTDSVYSHKAWVEHGLGPVKFPIIGDTNHAISEGFGVLLPEKGIALRGTFIIDPNGVVQSAVVNNLPVGRSVEETLRTLQAFQTGGLTPCEWKPGKETIKV
ncbi:MAG: thioredoxin peroxidase [Omnitrophica bacterium RIFCSPHIGHO2_02_FULL_46_11]|nr:MAG: thioredoxin peroxidase [Omnitrophica bacterium RIFCSPHIGHO2_02_FULL_46_11]OGW86802.1 MAG: thioredoxin peroxidase [Omnitrophica bacterium RIFCSPLOWO2_01_FULL_45_10b]